MSELPVENGAPIRAVVPWRARRAVFVLGLIAGLIALDQVAKIAARGSLRHHAPISWLGDLVRFEYAENPGAFLSLGASLPERGRFVIMTVLVGLVLAGALAFALWTRDLTRASLVGLTLVTGGGIGNLIDRIRNAGHVIDFVSMGIGPVRTGIFNVADLAITTGTLLLVFSTVRRRKPEPPSTPASDAQDPA